MTYQCSCTSTQRAEHGKFENESYTNKIAINMLSNVFIFLAIDTDRQTDIARALHSHDVIRRSRGTR